MSAPNEPNELNKPDESSEPNEPNGLNEPNGSNEPHESSEPSAADSPIKPIERNEANAPYVSSAPNEPGATSAPDVSNAQSAPIAPVERIEPVVELSSISMRTDRGGYVFRDMSLKLDPGESAIIVGASGSGKTLLTRIMLGVLFPESGTVRMFGQEIRRRRRGRIRRMRRKIGGVGGIFGLMPSLTVAENIAYPLILTGASRRIVKDRMLRMLSEFSLLKLANKYPPDLTRVESHLAQFARAAIANQPLMVIDEPAAGLDPANHARVFSFLVKVALSGRSMVILTSEPPSEKIPHTKLLHLTGGVLQ